MSQCTYLRECCNAVGQNSEHYPNPGCDCVQHQNASSKDEQITALRAEVARLTAERDRALQEDGSSTRLCREMSGHLDAIAAALGLDKQCQHEWTFLGPTDDWKYCHICRLPYSEAVEPKPTYLPDQLPEMVTALRQDFDWLDKHHVQVTTDDTMIFWRYPKARPTRDYIRQARAALDAGIKEQK